MTTAILRMGIGLFEARHDYIEEFFTTLWAVELHYRIDGRLRGLSRDFASSSGSTLSFIPGKDSLERTYMARFLQGEITQNHPLRASDRSSRCV